MLSYTYDGSGNPLSYYNGADYTFTWEQGRQLASVTKGNKTASYTYDMSGVRSSKTVNGVSYEYTTLSGKITRMTWSGNAVDIVYDDAGRPYILRYTPSGGATQTYYYVLNLQGDVVGLMNTSMQLVVRYSYDPWGKLTGTTATSAYVALAQANPLRYRSYCYDIETGFYYLQTRYYDPTIARFINADTTDVLFLPYHNLGQYNLFSYCYNNPINDYDEGGQLSWLAKIAIGAAAIAVGVGVTVITGGTALPALAAGAKAACVAGAISAGTSAATTAVRSAVSGDSFSTVVQKSTKAAVDGFADGFMAGGITAGASQVVSGGFKIAAELGAKTGKDGGIKLGNAKLLSPDAAWHKNNGGTLLKVGDTYRIDVGSNTLLHVHTPKSTSHIQAGTILTTVCITIYELVK